jgi:hypothetical protein
MTDKKHHGFVIDSGGTHHIITGSYAKSIHTYEVLPRNDHRGVDLISAS